MGIHLRVLSESYPMNTDMTGFRFLKIFQLNPWALDESSLSIGWIKVAVNVSSSGKPVLRFMYYVNEPGLTLLMKKNP